MRSEIKKGFWADHFRYYKWWYIGVIALAVAGWSLVFSLTEYQPPASKTLDVIFFTDYYYCEREGELVDELHERFPDMEQITIQNVSISDYQGQAVYQARITANEGDVYIIDRAYFHFFVDQLITADLDPYIADGTLSVDGDAIMEGTGDPRYTDGQRHAYAVSLADFYGMMNEFYIDNRDMMVVVTTYSGNVDTGAGFIRWLADNYYCEEVPDYADEFDTLFRQLEEEGYSDTIFDDVGF